MTSTRSLASRARRPLLAALVFLSSLTGASISANAKAEEPPAVIRFGVSNAGVGNPPRVGTGWNAIAQQRGFIEEEFRNDKTKVEWIFFKGQGPAVNEALTNKQLDFTTLGDLPSIVGRSVGVPARLVLVTGRTNTYLIARTGSGIEKFSDIRGKRIGLHKGTATQLAANRAFQRHKLTERDVKIVNLEPAASLAAFQSGDLDAVFGSNNNLFLVDKGEGKVVYSTREEPTNNGQGHILVHEDFSAKYPETTKRVVKALLKAAHYTSEDVNRAEIIKLWASAGRVTEAHYNWEYQGIPLAWRFSPLFDPYAVARNKQSVEEAFQYKLIRRKFDVDQWIDRRWLNAALKELQLENYWTQFDANGKPVRNTGVGRKPEQLGSNAAATQAR